MSDPMSSAGRLRSLLVALLFVSPLAAQQAPLLTVLPRQEQVRQLVLRGDLKVIRKQYLQALDFYQQARELDPDNPRLLNKLGIVSHQLLRLNDARDYYEEALELDPAYADAWNNLGTVRYAEEDYRDAVRHYRRALEANPVSPTIRSNLGTAYFQREEYDEAFEQYRVALLLDPEVFEPRGVFGSLVQEQSVENRARFYYLLSKSFASLGYVEKCFAYLRRALEDGFPAEELQTDPELAFLQDDPRFQALLAEQLTVIER